MSELNSFGEWKLMCRLGVGGFGDVALWTNRSTNQKIATKRLKENKNFREDEVSKLKQRWQQECKWMLSTDTPFIVRGISLKDEAFMAYLNDNHVWHPLPVLVMEYCNGGDLRAQLQKVDNLNGLHEYVVREVLFSLCRAIDHLHNKVKIEHRDLKPDNIVIHREGNRRFYKLTDFGFARTITHDTVLKSVVGTRNYFAPEVVDTAKYKNTVDYWSIGVIAFELMCGVLPFIPHQDLFQIISNIRNKPIECIAITENPDQPKKFIQHRHIFPQNRMTSVFVNKIENWLRSALDVNYKTRGTSIIQTYPSIKAAASATDEVQRAPALKSNRILTFYTEMDEILQTKILTFFYLNKCEFFSYDITSELTIAEWFDDVARLLQIKVNQVHVTFPAGHPRGQQLRSLKPIDFFVEEWQDTSNTNNPPVMLYITGVSCDFIPVNPAISDIMKRCFSQQECEGAQWVLHSFELHTHDLLSSEHHRMKVFLDGLKQYALTIEHTIFEFDKVNKNMQNFFKTICYLRGRIDQFSIQAQHMKQINGSLNPEFVEKWSAKIQTFVSKIQKIELQVAQRTENRYNSALRHAKEAARSTIYDDELKKVGTLLVQFRDHLEKSDKETRFALTQTAVSDCLSTREVFYAKLSHTRKIITEVHKEYLYICNNIEQGKKILQIMQEDLETNSVEMLREYTSPMTISHQMSSLSLDGTANAAPKITEDELILENGYLLLADANQTISDLNAS